MKAHHLYKLEEPYNYYLYVLQVKDYTDSMNVIAIRSDFPKAIIPLYTGIKYKEDLGYPTTKSLISINYNFYVAVKTAIVCYNLRLKRSSRRNHLDLFLRENISEMCYSNISRIQNRHPIPNNIRIQHSIFASINRIMPPEEISTYVKEKIS